ncbi:flagellar hook-length control protein FliK [Microbulbifer elongatus]|uniref:flagellar hook-length control protein FliK n=1 Tax=Microbulbifer elongatus TaxID=86173 RepID=UPI001E42E830|nr:flagellar hook-length control protein FliK [Microbulbifer elongatus]
MDITALIATATIKSAVNSHTQGTSGTKAGTDPDTESLFSQSLQSAIQSTTPHPLPPQMPYTDEVNLTDLSDSALPPTDLRLFPIGENTAKDIEQILKTDLSEHPDEALSPAMMVSLPGSLHTALSAEGTSNVHEAQIVFNSTLRANGNQQVTTLAPQALPEVTDAGQDAEITHNQRIVLPETSPQLAANLQRDRLSDSATGKPANAGPVQTSFITNEGIHSSGPAPQAAELLTTTTGLVTSSTSNLQPPSTSAPSISVSLGSNAWGEEFSQHLLSMVHRGDRQVDLHLHPRELGALSVSLNLEDQGMRAQFLTANAAVRSAVEHALPLLRETLAQQGITLGEASVGQHHQQESQQKGSHAHLSDATGFASEIDSTGESGEEIQREVRLPLSASLGGVDLYA